MAVSIAIDGPAGAGKSTIAKLLAAKMNYIYVDTGAMYRAMAVYFTQNHVNPDDEREINAAVSNVDITIEYMDGVQQVILNGDNVTGLLRTEETGKMASKTSKYAAVSWWIYSESWQRQPMSLWTAGTLERPCFRMLL